MQRVDHPSLRFEAVWVITNVAAGESHHTQLCVDCGALPLLKDMLLSSSVDVAEQAVWAIGNIAGDATRNRDQLLKMGVLDRVIASVEGHKAASLWRNCAWTISNLCRAKPAPDFQLTKAAIPTLFNMLMTSDDEVLADTCWALSYLTDAPDDIIDQVIQLCGGVPQKFATRVVELCMSANGSVRQGALRLVGNIVAGNDSQTQLMVQNGVVPALKALLEMPKASTRREAAWALSNVTAGNKSQIQVVVNHDVIPKLIKMVIADAPDVAKEAAWAVSNFTSGCTREQMVYLVQSDVVQTLVHLLGNTDPKIVMVGLEGLENVTRLMNSAVFPKFKEAAAVETVTHLQNSSNPTVASKARELVEAYGSM
eukprot:TRINITY_DN4991_c0_g1_i2.p1 TRINITY_DN4991_c0_g1~~TRINITY_DN4991_c0_g1_i2.p1  ORF type:complete len:368 (-),score=103.60 TRINITY_DN4991_c0_g1_i2:1159-2262(-)